MRRGWRQRPEPFAPPPLSCGRCHSGSFGGYRRLPADLADGAVPVASNVLLCPVKPCVGAALAGSPALWPALASMAYPPRNFAQCQERRTAGHGSGRSADRSDRWLAVGADPCRDDGDRRRLDLDAGGVGQSTASRSTAIPCSRCARSSFFSTAGSRAKMKPKLTPPSLPMVAWCSLWDWTSRLA